MALQIDIFLQIHHGSQISNMVAKEKHHARIDSHVSHDRTKLTKCFQLNASVTASTATTKDEDF